MKELSCLGINRFVLLIPECSVCAAAAAAAAAAASWADSHGDIKAPTAFVVNGVAVAVQPIASLNGPHRAMSPVRLAYNGTCKLSNY